jgi:hypothetical protein
MVDDGSHLLKVDKQAKVEMFKSGVPLGVPQYTYTASENRSYDAAKSGFNLDLAYKGKQKDS